MRHKFLILKKWNIIVVQTIHQSLYLLCSIDSLDKNRRRNKICYANKTKCMQHAFVMN